MRLLSHIGDILAIPFFALMVFYFYNIENKNTTENILYIFSICGLILDILFTYLFVKNSRSFRKWVMLL
jgi:hypothetical protein